MQTRQWHLFLVLVLGLPLKTPHQPRSFFSSKTAIWMLQERFIITKNTCKKFSRAFRGEIGTLCLCRDTEHLRAPPSAVRYDDGLYQFFYGAAALAADMMDPPVLYGSCTILTLHSKYGRAVTIVSFGHTSGNYNQMRKLSMNSYLSLSSSNFDDDAAVYR